MKTRDQYLKNLKNQLDRWNADLAKWETQAKSAHADVKKRYAAQLKDVHARREEALYNMRLIENASVAAWEDFTRGTDLAWERMQEAVKKARSHFEKA